MKITIEEIGREQPEEIILRCHEVNEEIVNLLRNMKTIQNDLIGIKNKEIHRLSFEEIYYFEVVDSCGFFYCDNCVYESRLKLYEFEEISKGSSFFRASKSMVLNADKIDYISPSFSGRFEVTLINGEKVIVSRQYVSILKRKIGL